MNHQQWHYSQFHTFHRPLCLSSCKHFQLPSNKAMSLVNANELCLQSH